MSAVMSLSSLCCMIGKPLQLQLRPWSTSKYCPHARACYSKFIWLPTIPEAQTISERPFVEAETMFFNRKDVQPMGGTFCLRENHCMFLWFV